MANFFGPSSGGEGSFDEFLARYLQGQNTPRQGRSVDINRSLSKRTREVVDGAAALSAVAARKRSTRRTCRASWSNPSTARRRRVRWAPTPRRS